MMAVDVYDCCSDQERAAWLLTVPFSVLVTQAGAIRAALIDARFTAGLAYLDAECSYLNRPRNAVANYEPMLIRAARGDLRHIAFGRGSNPPETRGEA